MNLVNESKTCDHEICKLVFCNGEWKWVCQICGEVLDEN